MITFVCVRTGTAYSRENVIILQRMVSGSLTVPHRFVVLTDQPDTYPEPIEAIDISHYRLHGWWAKMLIFKRDIVPGKLIYLDLDTVIAGNIDPLAELDVNFGICRNFTQLLQGDKPTWPCRFGSCCMVLADGYGEHIWDMFCADADDYMDGAGRFGDQAVIEQIAPDASLLQHVLPAGFFLHYKSFTAFKPPEASVLVFGGRARPENAEHGWIKHLYESHRELL